MNKFQLTKEKRYDVFCYIVMILFATAMLLIYSRETSPLFGSAQHGMDSIQYKSAGARMLDGYVPFKDFFQQKGVTFFYIQALGEGLCRIFGDDRIGTLILQFINFAAILGFMFCIAKLLLGKICEKAGLLRGIALLSMCPAMYIFVSTFIHGNYTEEYSILFNMVSVWFCVKYIVGIDENKDETYIHKPIYALIHSLLFSFAFWIRPNNCIGICTSVAFIVLILIIKKKYKNLFQNAGMFILGFVASSLIFLSYYIINGALYDVWYCQFAVNFGYVSANSKIQIDFLLPLILCILYGLHMLLVRKKDFLLSLLCEVTSVCMLAMYLILGSQYPHYCMFIMIPVFLFTLLVIRNVSVKSFKNIFALHIIIPLVLFCGASYIYSVRIYNESYTSLKTAIEIQKGNVDKVSDAERIGKEIKKIIPADSRSDIYVYPPNIDSNQIYYYANAYAFYKHTNPGWYEQMEASEDAELFYSTLESDSPAFVIVNESITEVQDYEYSQRTEDFIDSNYELFHSGDGFKVLKYVK